MVRLGLNSCLLSTYDDTFSRVLSNFCLFKSYNISTANLCIDQFLRTTKGNCVLPLLKPFWKKIISETNVFYFLLPMALT